MAFSNLHLKSQFLPPPKTSFRTGKWGQFFRIFFTANQNAKQKRIFCPRKTGFITTKWNLFFFEKKFLQKIFTKKSGFNTYFRQNFP